LPRLSSAECHSETGRIAAAIALFIMHRRDVVTSVRTLVRTGFLPRV
jgi:hypothetical protein